MLCMWILQLLLTCSVVDDAVYADAVCVMMFAVTVIDGAVSVCKQMLCVCCCRLPLGLYCIWNYVSFGIMLHLELCCIWDYVAFGIMLHLELCCIWNYVAFGIMLHLGLCRIWNYVAFGIMLHLELWTNRIV